MGWDLTNLPLATSHGDVHKSPRVRDPLLGSSRGLLLFLLRFDLGVVESLACDSRDSQGNY